MIEIRDLLGNVRRLEAKNAAAAVRKPKPRIMTISDVVRMHRQRRGINNEVDATWLRIQLEAILNGKSALLGPYDGVDGAWKDEPCFLVAGSRGLKNAIDQGFRFDMLDGFHSIGVNHVVEDYHNFEWLFFLDKHLIDTSRWDIMRHYRGRMFAHIKARLAPSDRVTVVYTQHDGPSECIIQGLYSFVVSGITAINLALISGADPIYLLGVDNGGLKNNRGHTHYKDDYPGERVGQGYWNKYLKRIPELLLKYAPYAERFRNVDPLGDITVFKKIGVRDIPELKERWST